MFIPTYRITNQLLSTIKHIYNIVQELNTTTLPPIVLVELERTARAISTFASTSIEGNPLPLTEVKRVLKSTPSNIRNSEREVLNYNHALIALNNKIKAKELPLSLKRICAIHKQVTIGLLPQFEIGTLRKLPVVVNDPVRQSVVYLPPDATDVPMLIHDLIEFINTNRKKIDPIILAGIFHKQMVIIHPFMDGNGRTTRLATKVLLASMGINTFPLFSFEQYYNQNVTKYFQMVGVYGDYEEKKQHIDFTPWLEYFASGIIDELLRIQKVLPTYIHQTPSTRLEIYHERMLAYIEKHEFITDREYAKLTDRAKATRALDFTKLISLGLIVRKGKGRSTYYIKKE